jgi:hypothetical protein
MRDVDSEKFGRVVKPVRAAQRRAITSITSPEPPVPLMILLRWIFRSVILTLLMKLLGGFFPILRRLLRLVWR